MTCLIIVHGHLPITTPRAWAEAKSNPNCNHEKSEVRHHATKNSNCVQRAELFGVLYWQMRLRCQLAVQGVYPMKKVVLSGSDVAVADPKIVRSGFHQRSNVNGLPASPPITPPVLGELLKFRHTTVTSPLSAAKYSAICCPFAFSSSSSSSPPSVSLSR